MYIKLLMIFFIFNTFVYAKEFAVVVHKQNQLSKLSKKQVKDIFLMKRYFVDNMRVLPVNISASSSLRDVFEKNVLQIDREKLNKYWVKKHFEGISPPIVQSSDISMKLFVKNVEGAIGYLPKEAVDSELRVVYEF